MLYFLFVIFCCLVSSQTTSSQETDTLQQGEFLNSSGQLVSANRLFVLGFHSPDPQNLSSIYLAIWYKNSTHYNQNAHNNSYTYYSSPLPVWIANRNTPIRNNSAILSLDNFGNLFIKGNTSSSSDSFNLYESGSQVSINTTATLLGTGNFIVRETNSNGSAGKLLWQSFDYPTDTLLPGMKLGVNHRTGLNWTLTSRFSNIKPRNGAFTLEWDPTELRLVVRRRGVISWTSGSLKDGEFEFWNAGIYFIYKLISVKNEDEEYFYYELANTSVIESRSIISGWFLDFQGYVYDPNNGRAIAILESCYGADKSEVKRLDGCESWEQPKCRSIHQKFELRSGGWYYSDGRLGFPDRYSNFSISDCREECWKDCNCVGYSYSDFGEPKCQIWSGENEFHQDYSGYSERHYVLISEASEKILKKKSKKWIPIVIAAVVVSLATLSFGLLCYVKRKNRQGKEKELLELMTLDGYTETVLLETDGKKGQDLKFFGYSSIVLATNSFSAENKLGEGGFGPVYKGNLMDGREIAVKRLSRISGQGLVEFKNELILIAKLQHTNLVRVLGCCMHRDEKMLIYEYMPNKSLDFFLFDQKNRSILDWPKRVKIIEGITQGLLYLHKYSRMRVIHRDLKASNILLDANMNPKISDFGMARIFKQNETEATTNRVVGTYGYMSPEYAMEGTFSEKSDVFSFGVLILEIVSGRRNNSFYNVDRPLNLIGYAWELWREGGALELKDPTIGHSFAANQMLRTVHVALLCVQESSGDRPNMSQVISMLSNETLPLPYPNQPAFFTGRSVHEPGEENYSINYASITDTEPR